MPLISPTHRPGRAVSADAWLTVQGVAQTQRVVARSEVTWTVVDASYRTIEAIEEYLEYLRAEHAANTVKAYARALALWWTFLDRSGRNWRHVELRDFGAFIQALRKNSIEDHVPATRRVTAVSDATVAARVRSVIGLYRYHANNGVGFAVTLHESVGSRAGRYLPFLEHIARRDGRRRSVIRVRVRRTDTPILDPRVIQQMLDAEARWDSSAGQWVGDLRYRLLWAVLAETGCRIGEALSIRHRDWIAGRGGTAQISLEPRDHPHGLSHKSGYRRVHVGSRLDRLYADYVWWLCDSGADAMIDDWDDAYVFCNTKREPQFAPLRAESVYDHLARLKRRHPDVPAAMTPHWFRHTHATALLLANTPLHVVSRRLGHSDVQTTINLYGHVTEDAELAAVANWQEVTRGWGDPQRA